jgi:hypothetical protein
VATICGVWILAASFAVPSAMSRYLCTGFAFRGVKYYQRVVIFELLVSCLIPLSVIGFTYTTTARHLAQNSRISEGKQNHQLKTRRNTAKIVVGLTFVFLISYVPSHGYWTYFIWNEQIETGYEIITYKYTKVRDISQVSDAKLLYPYLISTCFLLINPCLNPVALFLTSSPFRQHLKRYLTCFFKTNSPPTDIEFERRN